MKSVYIGILIILLAAGTALANQPVRVKKMDHSHIKRCLAWVTSSTDANADGSRQKVVVKCSCTDLDGHETNRFLSGVVSFKESANMHAMGAGDLYKGYCK